MKRYKIPERTKQPWTTTEMRALRQFLPQLGVEATASGLGRTPCAIVERAKALKIKLANLPT